MASNVIIDVEVVYTEKETQWIIPLKLSKPCTVREAILSSGILSTCPHIDLNRQKVGLFGVLTSLDALLKNGDRIEIYRPIIVNPMQRRREIAALTRKTRKK